MLQIIACARCQGSWDEKTAVEEPDNLCFECWEELHCAQIEAYRRPPEDQKN